MSILIRVILIVGLFSSGCVSASRPSFDIRRLEQEVRGREEGIPISLVGRIAVFGREIGVYPDDTMFRVKNLGACISGRDAEMPPQSWDGALAKITGKLYDFRELVPSQFVSYMENYCFSEVVLIVDQVDVKK